MEPELLILDEPMAGLDHAMQKELLAVLDHLHARHHATAGDARH
jgi:cobalt/nickel transport system ATP-binding protein